MILKTETKLRDAVKAEAKRSQSYSPISESLYQSKPKRKQFLYAPSNKRQSTFMGPIMPILFMGPIMLGPHGSHHANH
jgi:hypothetical protein